MCDRIEQKRGAATQGGAPDGGTPVRRRQRRTSGRRGQCARTRAHRRAARAHARDHSRAAAALRRAQYGFRRWTSRRPSRDRIRIRDSDAVQLFLQRARAVQSGFEPRAPLSTRSPRSAPRSTGCHSRSARRGASPHVSPEANPDRLSDRLSFVTGSLRDAPGRHQSLRAALDWSYASLLRRNSTSSSAGGCSLVPSMPRPRPRSSRRPDRCSAGLPNCRAEPARDLGRRTPSGNAVRHARVRPDYAMSRLPTSTPSRFTDPTCVTTPRSPPTFSRATVG